MTETITLTIENNTATITFNRPKAMNCFNRDMAEKLETALRTLHDTPNLRVVLLRGEGDLFMAGGDIQFFAEQLDQMPKGVDNIINSLHASITALQQLPVPILAAVHGAVAGAGISLMCATDLVIASEDAVFNLAYSGIGTSPDGGASYFLPRLVGQKKAMELLLLSDRVDAVTALNMGLINWKVPMSELWQTADEMLQRLANGPTKAYARIKQLLIQSMDNSLSQQLDSEAQSFVSSTTTSDFREGVTSFVERRPAQFEGE